MPRVNEQGQMLRCPTTKSSPTAIEGCGSTNLTGPDWEGLYDCLDCGIWFDDAENAEIVAETVVEVQ